MISTRYKILLILSSAEECGFIRQVLKNQEYLIIEALSVEAGIQKTIENSPDLIICQNEMGESSGFHVYNRLKDTLIKNCIPFFIYSDKFDQEDILIGLEMGIDNFIISPVDETALINKIEHQIKKIKKLKLNETERFKTHFNSTPVAKFIMNNKRIELPNNAFRKLMHFCSETNTYPLFEEIFALSGNKINLMNFRKCINGFVQQCNLEGVPCILLDGSCFDIHLYYVDSNLEGKLFAEVFPSIINSNSTSLTVSPDICKNLGEEPARNEKNDSENIKLTPREKEIFYLSSLGLPVKQIAAKLGISQRTIEKHRANIMQKTKTNSILEAIHILNKNNQYKLLRAV